MKIIGVNGLSRVTRAASLLGGLILADSLPGGPVAICSGCRIDDQPPGRGTEVSIGARAALPEDDLVPVWKNPR